MGPQEPPLAQGGDPVDGGQQLAGVLAAAGCGPLAAPLVGVTQARQAGVAAPAVGDDAGARLDVLADERAERGSGRVGQHAHPAPADALRLADLDRDAGEHLLAALPAAAQALLLPADERLVHLHRAGQPVPARPHQRTPQPVQHRPRRVVGADLQRPLQMLGGDPVLRGGEQPAGVEPDCQRRPRLIEDRARRHRGPPAAAAALDPAVGQPPAAGLPAARAGKPARPAEPLQVVEAVLVGAEPRQELTGRPRVVRARPRIIHELSVLRLTAYPGAGYYAYGRRQVEPRRKVPGRPSTGRVVKDASEWLVLLPGRLPAYITAGEYEANVARMAANRQTAATPGAPRDGAALLSGLLRCGRCGGHRMTVSYHDGPGAARSAYGYTCAFYQVNYGTGGRCQHIAGPALDSYVTSQVLDAVAPAALEVSMAAAAQAEDERTMLDKLWRQRLERARYAAGRARRQYQLAEPENRLVARQLEAGWEAALAETARLEADYQRFAEEQPAALTPAERAAIQALAADLPRVWHAPSTTQADRKELLRILIEDITATVAGDSELVDVVITWAGGHQTAGQAVRPVARLDQLSYYPALLARVTGLAAAGRNSRQIADVLNAEGFRPPKRTSRFSDQQVRTLISQRGIRGQQKGRPAVLTTLPPGEWSVPGLAAELGMPTATIYNWIYRGWITARHAPGTRNWIITADDGQMRQLRERRARPPGFYTRARWAWPTGKPDDREGTQL